MSIKAMKWAYGLFEVIDLPPAERSVLLALCWYHKDKSNECSPAQAVIAKMTGYRRQRVSEALRHLEGAGLIARSKSRKVGKFLSCDYRLFGSFKAAPMSGRGDKAKALTVSKKKDTVTMSGRGDTIRGTIKGKRLNQNVIDFPVIKNAAGGSDA